MGILISILDIFAPHAYKMISYMYFWFLLRTACFCESFEPRGHFSSRLSMIVGVNVVLNRTVLVDSDWRFDNLSGSHLQSQSELYHASWWYWHNSLWLWRWLYRIPHRLSKQQQSYSGLCSPGQSYSTSCFYCQYDLMFAGPKIPKPYWENNVWPMEPLWINVHTVRCRMVMPFVQKKS